MSKNLSGIARVLPLKTPGNGPHPDSARAEAGKSSVTRTERAAVETGPFPGRHASLDPIDSGHTGYPLSFKARHCAGTDCWRHDHAGASVPLDKHPRMSSGWNQKKRGQ